MDPAIEKSTERQSALDVAKAAFFAANGSIQHIPRGIGKTAYGRQMYRRRAMATGGSLQSNQSAVGSSPPQRKKPWQRG